MVVFGNIFFDICLAAFFGAIGGLAAELIDNKGSIEKYHDIDVPKHMVDVGVFSNVIIGAIAALVLFYLMSVADPYKFVGSSILAGVGGSAFLIAIKEKLIAEAAKKDVALLAENSQTLTDTLKKVTDATEGSSTAAVDQADNALIELSKATAENSQKLIDRTKKELGLI